MQVYIHTFIATREAYNLSPLQPTEPIHVRLFFSPHYISTADYRQYMAWLGAVDQCTEFHALGKAPATLTKASLLPANAVATQVGAIKYDFMLEAQEDYLAYLEFVRQTLHVEAQRPVFRPQTLVATATTGIGPEMSSYILHNICISSETVKSREEVPKNPELPTFLLVHPPLNDVSHKVYSMWIEILREDGILEKAAFYRLEDATCVEPQILHPFGGGCSMVCTSVEQMRTYIIAQRQSLYQLSTGHIIEERKREQFWGSVLGSEAMPLVSVKMSLSIQGKILSKQCGDQVLEMRLTDAKLAFFRILFENAEIRPFSLGAAYDLFATPGTARVAEKPTIRAGQLLGVNTVGFAVGNSLRAITDKLPQAEINPSNSDLGAPKEVIGPGEPNGLDAFACVWGAVAGITKNSQDTDTIRSQLRTLIEEFKASQPHLVAPPLMTLSPTLFQHAFLLYLLTKQESARSTTTTDYQPLIEYFKKSKMDLLGVQFSPVHLPVIYGLLAGNTDFLEGATAPEGLSILEARVLLSLYQYPLEYRNPQQQILLFQMLVKEFAKGLKDSEEGRVGAKSLWDTFLAFLRKQRLDFVGFFGSQQEFNEVLRELGWEQKRVAAGKVWLRMELGVGGVGTSVASSSAAADSDTVAESSQKA